MNKHGYVVKLLTAAGIGLPLLAIAHQVAFFTLVSTNEWLNQNDRAEMWIFSGMALFAVAAITGFGTAVYFLRLVFRAELPESQKTFWVTALLMFFPLAGPVFWYRVIWKGLDVGEATIRA